MKSLLLGYSYRIVSPQFTALIQINDYICAHQETFATINDKVLAKLTRTPWWCTYGAYLVC